MRWTICLCLAVFLQAAIDSAARARAPELDPLQGNWQVVELVIDGNVIPTDQIRYKLPSGGKIDIIDNAFIFKSPVDGRQHARTFRVDATRYPKQIFLNSETNAAVEGIYDVKGEKLVVCTSDPLRPGVPSEFAAPQGTGRMLLVMRRPEIVAKATSPAETTPAATSISTSTSVSAATPAPTAVPASTSPTLNLPAPPLRVITDTELASKLVGTWKHVDGEGVLLVTLNANRSFTTQRQFQDTQTFNRVFTNTLVSVGNWHVSNGALVLQITSSWRPERVNQMITVQVRSINTKEVVYVDQIGRSSRDVRIQ